MIFVPGEFRAGLELYRACEPSREVYPKDRRELGVLYLSQSLLLSWHHPCPCPMDLHAFTHMLPPLLARGSGSLSEGSQTWGAFSPPPLSPILDLLEGATQYTLLLCQKMTKLF